MFGPLLYLASCGLALLNPSASLALNLLLALFFAIPYRPGAGIAQASTPVPQTPLLYDESTLNAKRPS
jgi:hypothetical protein